MKKLPGVLCAMVLVFGVVGTANASLTVIGTATYHGTDYNLIYEDDSIDGGLVWLDYTSSYDTWFFQAFFFATDIGPNLTVNLDPGYTTDIDWSINWRLPLTQDPTEGYNVTGSEMGHLYYDSLGNTTAGPLENTGPFNELQPLPYWSITKYSPNPDYAWFFNFENGYQYYDHEQSDYYALAVHPGTVDAVPIPSAIWLLGSGLIGLVGFRKCRKEA